MLAIAASFILARAIANALNGIQVSGVEYLFGFLALVGTFSFWSRTAVVMLLFAFITPIFYFKSALRTFIYIVGGAALAAFSFTILMSIDSEALLSFQRTVNTLAFLLDTGGEQNFGDDVRFIRISFAANEMLASPFGSGFETYAQYLFPIEDIAVAENGFLDVGVRGGVLAMGALIILAVRSLSITGSYASTKNGNAIGLHAANLALILGGLPWLHFATEAYFSSLFWMFIAVSNCAPKLRRGPGVTA